MSKMNEYNLRMVEDELKIAAYAIDKANFLLAARGSEKMSDTDKAARIREPRDIDNSELRAIVCNHDKGRDRWKAVHERKLIEYDLRHKAELDQTRAELAEVDTLTAENKDLRRINMQIYIAKEKEIDTLREELTKAQSREAELMAALQTIHDNPTSYSIKRIAKMALDSGSPDELQDKDK